MTDRLDEQRTLVAQGCRVAAALGWWTASWAT